MNGYKNSYANFLNRNVKVRFSKNTHNYSVEYFFDQKITLYFAPIARQAEVNENTSANSLKLSLQKSKLKNVL
ncbi:MAG: hypothetical protein LBP59_07830 [Planctomycetaceae bacterium]|nr:hypothetical protein [Planctomycetaceae bacterium]